ncbi:MAG: hypothetical protein CME36_14835 [unclassified Hahellaceae]|nr:hypothetical protein [Hahellaceae bacterium]|tara:strand:+ start:857 stop:1834 length:978 start_codon:yes stop_codon:yes gene_type:complete
MKQYLKRILPLAGAILLSNNVSAFEEIYIFGDSLSDTGNAKVFSGNASNPAFPSRFSNGPVAVDVLTGAFALTATPSLFLLGQELGNNYAVGGAIAIDADGNESTPDTNLPTQINAYLKNHGFQSDPEALHVLVIGGNDLFAAQRIRAGSVSEDSGKTRQVIRKASEARVTQAVEAIKAQLEKLIGTGAQHILVGNAPDISAVPATDGTVAGLLAASNDKHETKRAKAMYKYSAKLSAQFNRELAAVVAELETAYGLDIVEWDLSAFLSDQIDDAALLGYTNTEDACQADGQLPLCTGYVFVDGVHPTTAVHQRAGANLLQLLAQ